MRQKTIILSLLAMATAWTASAQEVIPPGVQTPTTFAIVVDRASYRQAETELTDYKRSIEADGLGAYVLITDSLPPDSIRAWLQAKHAGRRPLEGCVLVGDVPIPMLRDAQHLTSAFKMDQRADWRDSSVPSDRYYDDFGLRFDYLKRDEGRPLYYYYSLRADSRQYLAPDIYSARIKPLELDGRDKYQLLRDYLRKVVREKRTRADNALDSLSMARGHGYNSEDRIAWAGEQLALREQLPQLFRPGGTVKFFDFDTEYPAKPALLNEVQTQGLDVMLFHHHGAPDTQYLNGYENVNAVQPSIANVKRFLRSKVASMARRKGREEAVAYYAKTYGVPREWCEEAFDPALQEADSLQNLTLDIYTTDLHALRPQARFVMLDACFNGSFYEKDYIAGAYLFNGGGTIATQGGTVNTIQDKWPDEFLGLLAAGMRLGQFNRLVCFLENHLMGDPTFHFRNTALPGEDINRALVLQENNAKYWRKQLRAPLPDLRALALRQLSRLGQAPASLLAEAYFQSDSFVVRLEAMRLLALNHPEDALPVLEAAVNDGYELIRRFAAEYIEKNADPKLIPAYVSAYLGRQHEKRLGFKIQQGLAAFDAQALLDEIDRQAAARILYDDTHVAQLKDQIKRTDQGKRRDLAELADTAAKASRVRLDIVVYRNHPSARAIQPLLDFIADDTREMRLRITAVETLGWYNENYRRRDIISGLQRIQAADPALKNEIAKTIRRLSPDGGAHE